MTEATGFRVLTVCLGNVCRSPLMERLLQQRLGKGFSVESAGLTSMAGYPMESNAAAELVRLEGSPEGFIARDFVARYADQADLVLTATAAIRSRVLTESPGALRRGFTLLELEHLLRGAPPDRVTPKEVVAWAAAHRSTAAGVALDLPDPIGRSPETHRMVADLIDTATGVIAKALTSAGAAT